VAQTEDLIVFLGAVVGLPVLAYLAWRWRASSEEHGEPGQSDDRDTSGDA